MKQLLKELFVLIVIVPICAGILLVATLKAEQSRQVEILDATVEKKELVIGSPVFGSIEELLVQEGEAVKEGQPLAIIKRIEQQQDEEEATLEASVYEQRGGDILIKSPTDATISLIELAEKSTVKPQANLFVLHPFDSTVIKVKSNKELNFDQYESILLTKSIESKRKYEISLTTTLPTSDKLGNTYHAVHLQNKNMASEFYVNQIVKVVAKKHPKEITRKIESFFTYIRINVVERIANL